MLQTPRGTTPRFRKPTMRRTVAAAVAVPVLLVSVAACNGDEGGQDSSQDASQGGGQGKPPAVTGDFGDTPKVAKGEGDPPKKLQQKVLKKGTGETVEKGDTLNVDYLGQLWNGKEFDSSFKRGQPATFQIGTGNVIKGWDEALVGKKLGSRVEIVVPPDKGYGEKGQPPTIPGNSTLVFVVDLKKIMPSKIDGKPSDEKQNPDLPKVGTEISEDKAPEVTMPKGEEKGPDELVKQTVIEGDGKKVGAKSTILANFTAKRWKPGKEGRQLDDTWKMGGPQEIPVSQIPGWKEALEGTREGSRVVFSVPKDEFPKEQQKQFGSGVVFSVDVINVS